MPSWTPTDPKTVIARTMTATTLVPHGPKAVVLTRAIARNLSDWIDQVIGDMDANDPRIAGLAHLANVLDPPGGEEGSRWPNP